MQRTWPKDEPWAGSGQFEAPHPLPCPWNVHCPPFLKWEPFSSRLERARCCWDHLGWIGGWTPLGPLCKLLRFWRAAQRSTLLVAPRTSLIGKFPFLCNLPPTNLECFTSFFSVSLPSEYRARLWTNSGPDHQRWCYIFYFYSFFMLGFWGEGGDSSPC